MSCAVVPALLFSFTLLAVPLFWVLGSRRVTAGLLLLAVLFAAMMVLVAGRPPVVLYLRPFRDERAPGRFGGLAEQLVVYYRIVTLSDPVTNPVTESMPTFLGCFAGWVVVAVPIFTVYAIVNAITGSAVSAPAWAGILILLTTIVPLGMKWGRRLVAWLRKRVTFTIETAEDLVAMQSRARRWRTNLVTNLHVRRIQTIGVADALWQDTVVALAAHVDAILIDASAPGRSLSWEIRTLSAAYPRRLVVIASESTGDPELRSALHGRVVLRAGKNFARNLRRAIWTAAQAPHDRREIA